MLNFRRLIAIFAVLGVLSIGHLGSAFASETSGNEKSGQTSGKETVTQVFGVAQKTASEESRSGKEVVTQVLGVSQSEKTTNGEEKSQDEVAVETTTETSVSASGGQGSVDCNGAKALLGGTAVYQVNGQVVPKLRDHVTEGATVNVAFQLKEGCKDIKLGLAAYEAPSGEWVPAEAKDQKLVDSDSGTFSHKDGIKTLSVTVPTCYFQVDFFTGDVVEQLDERGGYYTGNLISADNGGTKSCAPPPPVCPEEKDAQIADYAYTVSGKSGIDALENNVKSGDNLRVDFTIAEECENVALTLVAISLSDGSFDFDSGIFNEGEHSLEVDIPDCDFQVFFLRDPLSTELNEEELKIELYKDVSAIKADSFDEYSSAVYDVILKNFDVIDSTRGGEFCIDPAEETTTTTTSTTTSTIPVEVLGQEIVRPAPTALAKTGLETIPMTALGSVLTLGGIGLSSLAGHIRRKK